MQYLSVTGTGTHSLLGSSLCGCRRTGHHWRDGLSAEKARHSLEVEEIVDLVYWFTLTRSDSG